MIKFNQNQKIKDVIKAAKRDLLLDKERLHRDLTFCRFAPICIAVSSVISWGILFTLIYIAFDGASLNR